MICPYCGLPCLDDDISPPVDYCDHSDAETTPEGGLMSDRISTKVNSGALVRGTSVAAVIPPIIRAQRRAYRCGVLVRIYASYRPHHTKPP